MADMSLVRRLFRHSETIGSDRYRFPVKRNRALATAGAMTGTGGSPQPVGASVLGTMCASTVTGASFMYAGVKSWKFRCSTCPSLNVIAPLAIN